MSKMNQYDYDLENIKLSGNRWHLSKLAEECAELGAATLQYLNKENIDLGRVKKEISDVEIAINYFQLIFGYEDILKYKQLKYKRINRKVRKMMKENKGRNEN
jgi:hypothetical protein